MKLGMHPTRVSTASHYHSPDRAGTCSEQNIKSYPRSTHTASRRTDEGAEQQLDREHSLGPPRPVNE